MKVSKRWRRPSAVLGNIERETWGVKMHLRTPSRCNSVRIFTDSRASGEPSSTLGKICEWTSVVKPMSTNAYSGLFFLKKSMVYFVSEAALSVWPTFFLSP